MGDHGAVLVVRCVEEHEPGLGATVYDSDLGDVGDVIDYVGPVERPYAVVGRRRSVELGDRLYVGAPA
ncbi:MAG: H/ACA ribonucleoprotein complex subunit GAR1 [Halobacteriales archaeon]